MSTVLDSAKNAGFHRHEISDFTLPAALEAREPAEARGTGRDDVRLLVGRRSSGEVTHHRFRDLPGLLRAGDLLVVNDSATVPAALDVRALGGPELVLHVSTELPDGRWVLEPRRPLPGGATAPYTPDDTPLRTGTRLLTGQGRITIGDPYSDRLWTADVALPDGMLCHLRRHGRPIRYGYTDRDWPLSTYQTVFAREPGSAEMPSAARPFTTRLVTELVTRGVSVAPITLHTGVASPEAHERPYAERFRVPAHTARLVAHTKADGGRVIAVGTTAVRALESAVTPTGRVRATSGWTETVITPDRGVWVVDGLLTGFHEPRASHLLMLAAIGGIELIDRCYAAALAEGYHWHEFGDVNLLLP
jgi:S-adenosylmethionine:tRNA ribosyltransferase-isomerase